MLSEITQLWIGVKLQLSWKLFFCFFNAITNIWPSQPDPMITRSTLFLVSVFFWFSIIYLQRELKNKKDTALKINHASQSLLIYDLHLKLVGDELHDLGDDQLLEADVCCQQRYEHEHVFGAKLSECFVDVLTETLSLCFREIVTNNQSCRLECAWNVNKGNVWPEFNVQGRSLTYL